MDVGKAWNMGNNRAYQIKDIQMFLKSIGNNQTQIDYEDGTSVLFSYSTPVAALTDDGYYVTAKKWSVTTSRHINKWVDGAAYKEQPQEFFNYFTK